MHDSCRQVLTRSGYEVFTSFDGERGMILVREEKPDIVLLDLKMPGRDGKDYIHEIAQTDPAIVIVVITGYATVESAVEAMKLGAYDFLPKPFTPDELRMIVNRGMDKRNLLVETKRLQDENQRIRENFVSVITHEMRSPLVVVEQYIEVLLGGFTGTLAEKQAELLTQCRRRIRWLLTLVTEWLDMARIQETIVLERVEEVEIGKVLEEAIDLLVPLAEEKEIEIQFEVPDTIPAVMGNHEALVHLFMNLFSNAVKYNKQKGKITASVYEKEDCIKVKVSDTGIGIPEEMQPFIFDEFFRVRNIEKQSRSKGGSTGTGLGLAIAKKIVDAHKGYISLESEIDAGTTFNIYLPKDPTGEHTIGPNRGNA